MAEVKRIPYVVHMNRRTGHPAILVGRKGRRFFYLSMTSSAVDGHKKNARLPDNPKPSYFRKTLFEDSDGCFDFASCLDWELSERDREFVDSFLSKGGKVIIK